MIRARAPLRLGLGGGGSDLPAFSERYGGCVLNATIDLYAHATIVPLEEDRVVFRALDLGETMTAEPSAELSQPGKLELHQGVYRRIVQDWNHGVPLRLEMRTYSDVPPGSGLGSSSTMIVAMIKAYVEWLRLPLDEYAIAQLAYRVERIDLGLAGGKQDQYAAAFGGFNFMEFGPGERTVVNPLRIKNWVICELESSLVLFHSGVSRQSATIIEEQVANITRQDDAALAGLGKLRDSAIAMKESLLRGEIEGFADAMNQSWVSKISTAEGIATEPLRHAYQLATDAGAMAVKISGAGGGGFMMILVEPDRRIDVIRALESTDGQVFSCHFTKRGVEGWTV